jgi:hypothetical protein
MFIHLTPGTPSPHSCTVCIYLQCPWLREKSGSLELSDAHAPSAQIEDLLAPLSVHFSTHEPPTSMQDNRINVGVETQLLELTCAIGSASVKFRKKTKPHQNDAYVCKLTKLALSTQVSNLFLAY